MRLALLVSTIVASGVATHISIATFDNAKATTWPWQPVNDPVMGGRSHSTFQVDTVREVGVWDGEVAIVPFLQAPGFCNLQAPGLYKTAAFPDVSGTDGIILRARQTNATGLKHFNAMVMTKGAKHLMKEGVYTADVTLTDTVEEHFVPWSAFKCSWRGQKVTWCPEVTTQLSQITNIGVGTFFPGSAGSFHVELTSLSAVNDDIDLVTFDGTTSHTWRTENDPVMGGQSESTFKVMDGLGDYSGICRIVPKLQAPGFTFALTEAQLFARYPDVSSTEGIVIGARSLEASISTFKFAFCDSRLNPYRCQFQTYKADFILEPSDEFRDIFIPWSKFSDKWSAATGAHTAENPPKADSLRSITQLQIWVEGVAGKFHIQVKYIRAGKAPSAPSQILV